MRVGVAVGGPGVLVGVGVSPLQGGTSQYPAFDDEPRIIARAPVPRVAEVDAQADCRVPVGGLTATAWLPSL